MVREKCDRQFVERKTALLLALGGFLLHAGPRLRICALDQDDAVAEIDMAPAQGADLAAPHAGDHDQPEQ